MVKAFGAEVQQTNDPSYIGFSKEGDADRSMKVLFSGLGNVIDQKSDFYEQQQKLEADKVAENIVDSNAKGGEENTEDSIFTTDQSSVSTEIKNIGTRGQKLTQAYKEGKITASNYWAQMGAMVKAAKARYPAQADRIEAQVAQALGRRPAAAAIEEAREEWKSSVAEKNEEEKAFNRFVDTNIEYLPPDFFVRQNEGRPYTKIETRHYVMERQQAKQLIESKRSKLALAKEQGNLNEEEAVGTALDEVTQYVNRVLTDTADTSKNFQDLLKTAREKGKNTTPDEQMALRRSFAAMKFTIQEGVENILSKTWADNTSTYYNTIKSPEKIKHIREAALSRIDYYEKLINDKDYGYLNADVNRVKAMRDEVNRRVLESSDGIRVLEAVREIGGAEIYNDFLLTKKGMKIKSDAAKALHDVSVGRIMSGDAKSLDDEMNRNKQAKLDRGELGALNGETLKKAISIINDPKATPQILANAANALFGPNNIRFLENFKKKEQQMEVFARMAAPEVTAKMKELGKTNPDLWANYRKWAKLGFEQTFSNLARDVQEGIQARPNINIRWDPAAKQFSLTSSAERRSDWRNPLAGGLRGFENVMTNNVEKSLNEFNRQLRILTPIMEAEGQDVSQELLGFMNSLGLDDSAEKNLSFFTKIRQAMIKNFEKDNPPSKGGEGEGKKR